MYLSDENHKERDVAQKVRHKYKPGKTYRCKDCRKKIYKGGRVENDSLILHHVRSILNGGTSDKINLVILCNECHNTRHAQLRNVPELPLFRKRVVTGYGRVGVFTRVPDGEMGE